MGGYDFGATSMCEWYGALGDCMQSITYIDNLYFKSVIILHSKHELAGLLADYKITIQNITYRV